MAELCLRLTLKDETLLKKSYYTSSHAVYLHFIYWARFNTTENFLIHLEFEILLNRWGKCNIKCSVLLIPSIYSLVMIA